MLFAAGRGERLRPLTDRVPKAALPVGGVPLGAYALAALERHCHPVIVNTSYRAAAVRLALEPYSAPEHIEFTIERPRPLGTAGTLRALSHRLAPTFMTHNSDVLSDVDLRAVVDFHDREGAGATLVVAPCRSRADVAVDRGRVVAWFDRRTEDHGGMRFAGVAAFGRTALEVLGGDGPGGPGGLAEALLRPMVETGACAAFVHEGVALDVGTPARLAQAESIVARGLVARPRPKRACRP